MRSLGWLHPLLILKFMADLWGGCGYWSLYGQFSQHGAKGMIRESILEVNAALNTLEAQAVEHPQFQEVRNIVYFLKRDLLMLSRRLGFYDLELP